jgi:hypothetical protein
VSEGEWNGDEWAIAGGFQRGAGVLYHCGELRPRWSQVDVIGLGGRRSGAVLYAESSGVVVAIGGEMVWMGWPRVQIGCI